MHKCDMKSSQEQKHLIRQHVQEEIFIGHLLGPLPDHLAGLCHSRPVRLIPKLHQPGKWRLIVYLSSPCGSSVNDAIDPGICSLSYASVDNAVCRTWQLGRGTMLAKVDLRKAYRMVPVHPDDHALLGMRIGRDTFIDTVLPFGLRSAPNFFLGSSRCTRMGAAQQGGQPSVSLPG